MRIAIFVAVALLAGCASGGPPGNTGDVDASVGGDGASTPDAQTCDGPMQLPCGAVYVAKSGNDSAAGTKAAPLKTIAVGIAKAGATGQKAVFVKYGIYAESITMSPGITVYGGFDDAWERNPAVDTEIVGTSPTVRFEAITVPTVLDGVTVKSADATGVGESSYAVLVTSSQMIELRDVTVVAGIGAAGQDGSNGSNGASGGAGIAGNPGVERSTATFCDFRALPAGGSAGTSACGRSGGAGGTPGT
ncbi:MAG: hypothetical protein H0T89_02145, partial [Deltaproteobacteria bacterium]|nr:hypothetical protein [Deltaproteobacteria bacterium]